MISQFRPCLWLSAMCIVGWAGQPSSASPHYALDHLTTREGLPQSTVKAITQSKNGFLWIGTEVGLARYDGYQFRRYDAPFGQGVAQRLFADSQGRIWVSWFDKPITIFDPADDSWKVLEAIQPGTVRSGFFQDGSGTIWLIDRSHLYLYDEQAESLVPVADLASNADVAYWQDMLMLNSVLWISAYGEIVGYDIEKRGVIARLDYDPSTVDPELTPGGALKLWINDERIWFCSRHGVYRVSGLSDIENVFANRDRLISSCGHDREGQLWIGTFDSGALRVSTTGDVTQFRHESGSLDTIGRDAVNNFQLDSNGNLWITTYGIANL